MSISDLYKIFEQFPSLTTDTRKLKKGDIFFALKGPNFNANSLAKEALAKGAAYAVIDDPAFENGDHTILVDDALQTLQSLALHHRLQFSIPVIAVTGSNGKTTTRELINAVLNSSYKTYSTLGNLNNHIGIPLTLLSIGKDAEMVVIEMGANHLGEIADYCRYVRPTHGLITNCGKAHLEGFGSEEGVRKGKGELFDFLRENGGTAFVFEELSYLVSMSRGISKTVFYGGKSNLTGTVKRNEPFLVAGLRIGEKDLEISSQLVGSYNLPNILAAMSVAKEFGVPEDSAAKAIASYIPSNNRSQLIALKSGNKVILDAYNANPSSMKIAIENLASMPADQKILVLGAMAELGPDSEEEHRRLIDLIVKHNWSAVLLVGGDFLRTDHPFEKFPDALTAGKRLQEISPANAYILIKGSRSMGMEKVLEQFQ